jgi:hypothetical protein
VVTRTQVADAEVALTGAELALEQRLDEALKAAIGSNLRRRRQANKARLAPKPHQRWLGLEVGCQGVDVIGDGLIRHGGDVDELHYDDDNGDDAVEWKAEDETMVVDGRDQVQRRWGSPSCTPLQPHPFAAVKLRRLSALSPATSQSDC